MPKSAPGPSAGSYDDEMDSGVATFDDMEEFGMFARPKQNLLAKELKLFFVSLRLIINVAYNK